MSYLAILSNIRDRKSYELVKRIAALVKQIYQDEDEHQSQKAARLLGKIAVGDVDAIQALVNLIRTTQDNETLWTALESLWQIDPGNSTLER